MSRIFISHATADSAEAQTLSAWLRVQGWESFVDLDPRRGLAPGQRWQQALWSAIDQCQVMVCLLSPAWCVRPWCLAEFIAASLSGKRIFGVIVKDVSHDQLPRELMSEWQVCNLVPGAPLSPPGGGDVSFDEDGLGRLERGLRRALEPASFPWPPAPGPWPPYPGLQPFSAAEAPMFFGRDAEIHRAGDVLRAMRDRGPERMLVIVGASGSGKSSFLRAGLAPRLSADDFLVLPVIRPEQYPVSGPSGLAAVLSKAFSVRRVARSRADVRAVLRERAGCARLLRELRTAARLAPEGPAPTPVVCIDQGEELFASDRTAETEELLSLMAQAMADDSGSGEPGPDDTRTVVVVAIRSESLERLETAAPLRGIHQRLLVLAPLSRVQYKAVVEGPAARATEGGNSLSIDPAFTERVLDDAQGADALPLLAFTLRRMFDEHGGSGALRLGGYEAMGGIRGSIQAAMDDVLDGAMNGPAGRAEGERLLRQAFIPWLAQVDPETGQRRGCVADWNDLPPASHPLLERMIERRVLVRDRRRLEESESVVVEVAHEALLRQWPALHAWLDEDAEALGALAAVRRAAAQWVRNHRDDDWLDHKGERLAAAEALPARREFQRALREEGRDYLIACRAREEAEARGRQVRKWALRALVGSLLVVSVSLLVVSVVVSGALLRVKRSAEAQTRIAADGDFVVASMLLEQGDRDTPRAIAHLTRALRNRPEEWRAAERLTSLFLERSWPRRIGPSLQPGPAGRDTTVDIRVTVARMGPDGRTVMTVAGDSVQLWDAQGKLVTTLSGHRGRVTDATFSADGGRVLTTSDDQTARLWDAVSGRPLGEPLRHGHYVSAARFSPDGKTVLTLAEHALLWDPLAGVVTGALDVDNPEAPAAFSPDGQRVLVVDRARDRRAATLRVCDLDGVVPSCKTTYHGDLLDDAAFSPDGMRIVTASWENEARLWDADTGKPRGGPMHHDARVRTARFSHDGMRVVTASSDRTARLWDAFTGEPAGPPLRHDSPVSVAAFTGDDRQVLTGCSDGTVRLWDSIAGVAVGEPVRAESGVFDATLAPDGRRVLVGAELDAQLWDLSASKVLPIRLEHEGPVRTPSFSPDGRRVLTAAGKRAYLWDAATGKQLRQFDAGGDGSYASLSPDGRRVVTSSGWHDVVNRLWDPDTGRPVGDPITLKSLILSDQFTSDGQWVLAPGGDNTVLRWSAVTGRPAGLFSRHEQRVSSVSLSPDGKRAAITFWPKYAIDPPDSEGAQLWDPVTRQLVGALRCPSGEHAGSVNRVAFSPDSQRLVIVCHNAGQVWDARSGRPMGHAFKNESFYANGLSFYQFSPDSRRIVTADGLCVRVWDAATGDPIGDYLCHPGGMHGPAFSPDGRRLVTVSGSEVRLWDGESGIALGEPWRHDRSVSAARFSPDGQLVVTASDDGSARLWRVPPATGVPAWFLDWAEQMGGRRFDEHQALQPVKWSAPARREGDDLYSEIARRLSERSGE